jgi:hypothetical protein
MTAFYSDILGMGVIVLVLMSAALYALWNREDSSEFEPVKPLRLSPEERELLFEEKMSATQKALEARSAAKKAARARRRELAKASRPTVPDDERM